MDPSKWYETIHRAVTDSGLSLRNVLLTAAILFVVYKFVQLWRK